MGGIIAAIGSLLVQLCNSSVAKWLAEKALFMFLFVTVLPIILNNWMYDMIQIGMNLINGQNGSAGATLSGATSWTGLTAWLMDCFQIPACLSLLFSVLILKTYLRLASPIVKVV